MSLVVAPALPEDELAGLAEDLLALEPVQLDRFLATCNRRKRELLERALAAKASIGWRATPTTMMHHLARIQVLGPDGRSVSAPRYKLWRYSLLLGEQFRKAVTGESIRQIWNIESRYGKSLIASQWGPAWALDRNPRLRLILSSYGDKLADENADAVRQILRDHADVLRVQLRRDRQQIDRFVTTGGGGLLAAGIDSAISGFPGDGIVLDDPFKDWQEAHSEARREHVDNQYRSVLRMRAETEQAWIIVVHNRWHEDDLTGRLVRQMEDGTGESWELVRLPTIAEAPDPHATSIIKRLPDPLGRAPGELLEPERFSKAAVEARALALGSYLSSAMQRQDPAPAEGGEVKRAWFRLEDAMPARCDQWITSWDMKLKDKESGDYVVGQVWGRTGKDCWLFDQLRGQWGQATVINAIALLAVRWPQARSHVIENTGNGPEVMEALRSPARGYTVSEEMASQLGMTAGEREAVTALRRRGLGGLMPHNPKGPKPTRMRAVIPYIEAGDVHLDGRATWLGAYLDEMAAFPRGTHDDQCDATSQALGRMHRLGVRERQLSGSAMQQARAGTV